MLTGSGEQRTAPNPEARRVEAKGEHSSERSEWYGVQGSTFVSKDSPGKSERTSISTCWVSGSWLNIFPSFQK